MTEHLRLAILTITTTWSGLSSVFRGWLEGEEEHKRITFMIIDGSYRPVGKPASYTVTYLDVSLYFKSTYMSLLLPAVPLTSWRIMWACEARGRPTIAVMELTAEAFYHLTTDANGNAIEPANWQLVGHGPDLHFETAIERKDENNEVDYTPLSLFKHEQAPQNQQHQDQAIVNRGGARGGRGGRGARGRGRGGRGRGGRGRGNGQ
jgi:hypothetical protein